MSDRALRWGGLAGLVFVALVLVAVFSAGQPPAADDPVDKIREFFVDHRGALLIGNFTALLGIPFAVWHYVTLRQVLRGDREADALGTAMLAGLLLAGPCAIIGGALFTGPVYVDGVADKLSDDTLRLVYEAQNLMFAGTSAGIVVLAASAFLAIRRTNALPSYVMWLAALAVVGNLVTMASTLSAGAAMLGFLGVLSWALFIVVTGIAMAAGKATAAPATP